MPTKSKKAQQAASKKAEQKKKQQVLEDKTFGLKNKNKSKKVQNHIQSVTKSVMNSGTTARQRQLEEQRVQAKKAAKARRKAEEAERDALFGEALLAVSKKKTTSQKEGKQEAKGRDADDDNNKKGTSRAMKMMYQMDAKEMEERLKEDVSMPRTLALIEQVCQFVVLWLARAVHVWGADGLIRGAIPCLKRVTPLEASSCLLICCFCFTSFHAI